MERIKIAIIGYGYWGPNLLRNFLKVPEAEVIFACDLNEAKLKSIQNLYPQIKITANYKEILVDDGINAVCIATPVSTHFEITKEAMLAGKHVLVEKPMTSTVNEAEELVKIAKEKNRVLMVDHTFVYTGAVRKIKELIDNGELGDIYYFDSQRVNLGLIRPDSNVVFDLAPHDFSIVDYLFSGKMPQSVSTVASKHVCNHCEEMAHITMNYPGGVISHAHVSWLSPIKLRTILVGGSKKMVLYDDVEPTEKIRIYDRGVDVDFSKVTPFNPLYRNGDILIPKIDQTEALEVVCRHFIDCIKNNKTPITDGEVGLRIVKLLEATNESIKNNGQPVNLI